MRREGVPNVAKTYLVGGAVRDQLLNRASHDRDWVVVGASPEDMLLKGYKQVGADFPVFLHPTSGEEFALARAQRKSAVAGVPTRLLTDFSKDVTLEEDLWRRDLTINAMAWCPETGALVDPFNGQQDLKDGVLRHVSYAFEEDPLRVLRVARFMARFSGQGFKVARETLSLMRSITTRGLLSTVAPERIWAETHKALQEERPSAFFQTLRECGALRAVFPEINALFGVPQPEQHHPEIDTGVHTLLVLDRACELSSDPMVRFAALCHDLGKGTTLPQFLPHHQAHELRGSILAKQLCVRLKVPNDFTELACLTAKYHTVTHTVKTVSAKSIAKMLERLDAYRRPERFEKFLLACEADAQGRTGFERVEYIQPDIVRAAKKAAEDVSVKDLLAEGFRGNALGQALHKARIRAIYLAVQSVSRSRIRDNHLEAGPVA